jgi:hypothetical protein
MCACNGAAFLPVAAWVVRYTPRGTTSCSGAAPSPDHCPSPPSRGSGRAMEEIRWGLLWRQMSVEEQWLCMLMLGLIVLRIAQKLTRALNSLRGDTDADSTPAAEGTAGEAKAKTTTKKDWAKGGKYPGGKRLRVMLTYTGLMGALGAVWWWGTTPVRVKLPTAELDALALDLSRGVKLPAMPVRGATASMRLEMGPQTDGDRIGRRRRALHRTPLRWPLAPLAALVERESAPSVLGFWCTSSTYQLMVRLACGIKPLPEPKTLCAPHPQAFAFVSGSQRLLTSFCST